MDNKRGQDSSTEVRKTRFTILKEQQCSLNMRIRLAMEMHDGKVQADLERELEDTLAQIEHLTCQPL